MNQLRGKQAFHHLNSWLKREYTYLMSAGAWLGEATVFQETTTFWVPALDYQHHPGASASATAGLSSGTDNRLLVEAYVAELQFVAAISGRICSFCSRKKTCFITFYLLQHVKTGCEISCFETRKFRFSMSSQQNKKS